MAEPLRPAGETREEGIARIMRDLDMDRPSAEIFYDSVEGTLDDTGTPPPDDEGA